MTRLDLSVLETPLAASGVPLRAPLNDVEEDPEQPRTEIEGESFQEFVEDVRMRGILQPLVVSKMASGKLRIRFGARRYRAAVLLGLADVPYVLTEDERQLDDYAQVSENEKRKGLEPLELANFISKRVASGDSKATVARKLGIPASSVTALLALAGGSEYIKSLYHSRKSRVPQHLYRLSLLHSKSAAIVEKRVAAAEEINLGFLEALTSEVAPKTATKAVVKEAHCDRKNNHTSKEGSEQAGQVQPHGSVERLISAAKDPTRIKKPLVLGKHAERDVMVVLNLRPTIAGQVYVRYEDSGEQVEIACSELAISQLTESSAD